MTSSQIKIVVGTNEWKSYGAHYYVKEIITHERYGRLSYNNDIALIRVWRPIQFNEKVQPIKYTAEEVQPGSELKITGWGAVKVLIVYFIISSNLYVKIVISIFSPIDGTGKRSKFG